MSRPPILICPVNFSEGRRREVIEPIVAAASNPMVRILDLHSDPDHGRSVITLAGPSSPVVEACFSAIRQAASSIDISHQPGVHPRMGAIDVVPFVPAPGEAMAHAQSAALDCAKRVAHDLGIPCFLYELSAVSRDRASLPDIRRAAFDSIAPDLGPPRPHPTAGAIVIGARETLVAYNIELDSTDIEVAVAIARSVRESAAHGRGLPYLRAMAFRLESRGRVQVSMNLTRPDTTTLGNAYDAVARAASAARVSIAGAEVVGLVPRASLVARPWGSIGLAHPPKILEDVLEEAFPRRG